ncbi:MAG TPA: hypothetical protein VFR41_00620, partial [Acidimicrobiia bacterium]|nr:hypothetical protein [Acidimicrobiia bacterium]
MIRAVHSANVDPNTARDAARHILRDRRFHTNPAPRPLRGVLEWIGDRLSPIRDWLGSALTHIIEFLPPIAWLLIALSVFGLVVIRTWLAAQRRRVSTPSSARIRRVGETREDPAELEREADRAERAGDHGLAIRLRFRAGLLRLGDRGTIQYRPSIATGEVRAALGSETFDDLAHTFDAVAYGGVSATADDTANS